jgi:farnesol dehydrogenase
LPPIFVTGGTGYLGSALVARLVREGEEVAVLTRRPQGFVPPAPTVRAVGGDVLDLESLRREMRGCDRIFHAAAHVKMWDPDPGRFEAINVGGLQNVLTAAEEHSVSRIVYTSSFIALGPTDGTTADESWDPPARVMHNAYERTKAAADRAARAAVAQGAPMVILYPGVIYGPGPATWGNLVGKTVSDYLARRLPGILGAGDRRFCYAFAADVVEGHLQALRTARTGERFILGGENLTLRQVLGELERITQIPAPRRHIPYALAELAGRLQRWRANLTGKEPEITDEVVRIYRHEWAYASLKAQRDLGYTITPFARGLEETVRALRQGEA